MIKILKKINEIDINMWIKSPTFFLSFLLVIIIITILLVPKANYKNIFNVNKIANAFTSSDALYNRSVYRDWSVSGNAWGENIGWLTFSPNTAAKVYVADDALSGYLYGENIGWISLSCRNTSTCGTYAYGVSNDNEGNLTGQAWGENIGWIDFGSSSAPYQVRISSAGIFSGYAYGENIGFINFGLGSYSGTTSWRPRSTRAQCDDGVDNDQNGTIDYPNDVGCISLTDDNESRSVVRENQTTTPPPAESEATEVVPDIETEEIIPTPDIEATEATSTEQMEIEAHLPAGYCFAKNLNKFVTDPDVSYLQIFLNEKGFSTITEGAETNYYGAKTITGVTAFQEYYHQDVLEPFGLTEGTGIFGTATRNKANSILGCSTTTEIIKPIIPHVSSRNQDLVVGPNESGTGIVDTDIGQIILEVPINSVTSTTTFSVSVESVGANNVGLISSDRQLVNETFYNFSAKDNNLSVIRNFSSVLSISLPLSTSNIQGLGVYWLDSSNQQWTLVPNVSFANNKATFQINHFTTFAIFAPVVVSSPITQEIETTEEEVAEATPETTPEVIPVFGRRTEVQNVDNSNLNSQEVQQQSAPIISNITNTVQQSVQQTVEVATQVYEQTAVVVEESYVATKEVVNSPAGSVVTKTVATTGIVAGAGASIGAAAVANPITFAEIWLVPTKVFGLLLGALGIRRKNRKWGTVYDSITKRPLDPVYVSLINTETNKEVSGSITDIDGRYGFLVLPGKYRIDAKKTNYVQPSMKLKGQSSDEVYSELYFGEEITITHEGEIITKNIPMDSLSFDWNEFAKTKMNVNTFMKSKDITWAKISNILFGIGAMVSLVAVVFSPAPYNAVIAIFYIVAYVLNHVVLKTKKSGVLKEKNTNAPLSFAIVNIFREGEEVPLTKKVADKFGDYYALVPKGKYYLTIDKKNDDATYSQVFKTEVMEVNNGVINTNFII